MTSISKQYLEKAIRAPKQPTAKERAKHALTHLPYRTWCPICVQAKRREDHHPKQTSKIPVIQCDITFIKGINDKQATPIFTAIDVETGMAMAAMVQDRQQQTKYLQQCLQNFLMECGRVQAALSSTILQSDRDDFLISLLRTVATTLGGQMSVRQSLAYSSQIQGAVERFHRTLAGQIRTLRTQLNNQYNTMIGTNHPIMPWILRHAAYLLNRYSVHKDGQTSYHRRWAKDHKSPLCEFGETINYMIPHLQTHPKLEARFFIGLWLGRDTMTNEHIIGIPGKVIRARTIRRQTEPEKYNRQLMDTLNVFSWSPLSATLSLQTARKKQLHPPMVHSAATAGENQYTGAQTTQPDTSSRHVAIPLSPQPPPASAYAQMAISPTSERSRSPLPTQTKREASDETAEGSTAKQQRTTEERTTLERPIAQQQRKQRISAVTVTTKKGEEITTASCEDEQKQGTYTGMPSGRDSL